ncbi:hypothetical protein GO730_32100 [Spirosoma sp. HMF3257]|uniref:DUF4175 domain-containing protein n=1 Tax=Spirosoma telluris TaxID=2183553 RepID=A0A327NXJ8_9BACT|nr:hypothetical protein [Spirosoma telluris]RAI77618.1 hypothetical protein HMF3257_31995 [Spirosoma telluris]
MNKSFGHTWTIPILLGISSLAGLLSALVGDGSWDALSWLTLSIPLIVIGRFVIKPTGSKKGRV